MTDRSLASRRSFAHSTWTAPLLACAATVWCHGASAQERADYDRTSRAFQHVGTFSVPSNLPAGEPLTTITSAEIVDVSRDGNTLVYSDSLSGRIGFIDISDASNPVAGGVIEAGGEPTSIAFTGGWVLAAVNTRADPDGEGPLNEFDLPSGELVVLELSSRTVVRRIALRGQPDSIAISPDQRYAAIVIENERDEDENEGLIPQLPEGSVQVIDLRDAPETWMPATVDLTGVAEIAPEDPEPEFVDINGKNQAIISLQENNHFVVVDLRTRSIVTHFSAGTATVDAIDATQEELGPQETGVIALRESVTRRREPDAVAWIDDDTFASANEGDYEDANGGEGGTRSFTVFNVNGNVEWESGNAFEYEIVRAGHYPESRSSNKGNEPEGLEVATIGGRRYLFVGSERANVVGVYDVTRGTPEFVQILPTGIEPEGIKAIPNRNLLAVSAELDGLDEDFEVRSLVTLYALRRRPASYPMLLSADEGSTPIPWVAISGLSGDPRERNTLWAVSDSALAQSFIYRIDASRAPAVIEERIAVGAADGALDLEGIAARAEGGFWLASEGLLATEEHAGRTNAILQVDAAGAVLATVQLPEALVAQATASGFEGVAVTGTAADGDETIWVAIQRPWKDDAAGFAKIGRYDVAKAEWTFALYPLDAVESPNGGWVGLSEITKLPDGRVAIIERDNQIALDARIKRLYTFDPAASTFAAYGQTLPALQKTLLRDVLEDLDARSISVPDKLEGAGVTADGRLFLATDNDGVDENYGETLFFSLGRFRRSR
jgi:hypothetical protein